MKSAQNSKI